MNWKTSLSLVALLACGCQQQVLYTGLPEKDANDMVAILLAHQLNCDKIAGAENTWNITIGKDQFSEAIGLLHSVGYPRDKFSSMGEVFKKSGLVSSPLEERIRFIHALSENLAETITHISGVVTARVHIVLPNNDPYSTKILPSSASVFISHLPQVNLDDCVRDIRQLVTNSIEGLVYDKVNVVLFPADSFKERFPSDPTLFQKTPPEDSILKNKVLLGCLAVGLGVGILGFISLLRNRSAGTT